MATRFSQYEAEVVPAMQALQGGRQDRRTGGSPASASRTAVLAALALPTKPAVVQAIANLMDSAGGLNRFGGPARPREIIAAAKAAGCGVMGIRAVQAGALTRRHRPRRCRPTTRTPRTTNAPPRSARSARPGARTRPTSPTATRSASRASTPLVLGVKNRAELASCVAAEAAGPLEPDRLAAIDALGLRA